MDELKTMPEEKMFSLPTQQEAAYNPAGGETNRACSNCRFFMINWDGQSKCHLIDNYPEPIVSNGVCNRHEIAAQPVVLEAEPIPVVIVDAPMLVEAMALNVPKNLVERVKAFIAGLGKSDEQPVFQVYKAANGRKAWIARHTGKWIDRENEIIADAAHDAYVTRVQSGSVKPPELWMWHNKATKHGEAVTVWKAGGFVLAAGYFDETPAGEKAFAYYQKHSSNIKLSHMFHYPQITKIGGVYHDYNTIEITTLPDGAEAFPYTSFEEIQTMALPEQARTMITEALGEDVLQAALAADGKAESDSKALDGQGIASKGYDQYPGSALLDAAQKVDAFMTKQGETETRLAAAEATVKALADLPDTIKALNETVKQLSDKLQVTQQAESDALGKIGALEKQLAEYKDLKAPASQSDDALLNAREKTLIDSVMTAAKVENQPSLVEKLLGGQPAISTVNGG